jgi:predicted RNase H-related nuclease YkuK (DUF458 family)
MLIYVKTRTGKTLILEVESDDLIESIRQQIFEKEGS